ncbi:MAG: DUF3159 domain-containing protein [Aeromicrobium sp.]|uniref:DUF3159 domain-containing protein n=1 Tax=Aeromicrobium sp. TaxID=1871063 RepID=UPI0025BC17E6|nr:DUF3159 domain-containing protein [Aeromicrobium sp.]MCK5891173.1 DUF3159 domain-containing protein [Aeromicrobium sp.]MDF1705522.1 DUF3159 domain-containing protein [Aeromicrobium sp.]
MPEPTVETVEELVRRQLAAAFGGLRGVVESAVPSLAFLVAYLVTDELRRSIVIAVAVALVLLVIRLVQRSTPQFVINALIVIGIGALFASRSGEARDVFLPGILYNGAYAVVLIGTILVGWPVVGFLVGSLSGDVTSWHRDSALVALCSRLTWLLAAPCVLRVLVQYPLYAADEVGLLGTAKIVMGWPLQVAALLAMAALLSRNSTPASALTRPALGTDDDGVPRDPA